jgi:hypothetical protein
METTNIIEVIKPVNARSRCGRKRIPNKTTPYGLPEDPDYHKKYYEQNIKQPILCDGCGSLITKYAMKKHKLTNYCIQITIFKIANKVETQI